MRSISEALGRCDYYQPAPPTTPAAPRHPRLLTLVLLSALTLALLTGCATIAPEIHSTAAETAAPTATR